MLVQWTTLDAAHPEAKWGIKSGEYTHKTAADTDTYTREVGLHCIMVLQQHAVIRGAGWRAHISAGQNGGFDVHVTEARTQPFWCKSCRRERQAESAQAQRRIVLVAVQDMWGPCGGEGLARPGSLLQFFPNCQTNCQTNLGAGDAGHVWRACGGGRLAGSRVAAPRGGHRPAAQHRVLLCLRRQGESENHQSFNQRSQLVVCSSRLLARDLPSATSEYAGKARPWQVPLPGDPLRTASFEVLSLAPRRSTAGARRRRL